MQARSRRGLAAAVALTFAMPLSAQSVSLRDVPKPVREIAEPFSMITSITEVRPRTIVVVDGLDAEIAAVDFAAGTRKKLGRQGAGPGEYRAPGAVFRLQGDTVWVLDGGLNRLTVFTPNLEPGAPFPFMTFDAQSRTVLIVPMHGDQRGRIYASGLPVGGGPNTQVPDSVDIVRVDPRQPGSRAVIGRVRFPTSGRPESRVEGNVVHYTAAFPGLTASDVWAAFPDGRVVIVRGATYAVEIIAPDGRKSTAPPIAYDRIPVTAADKVAELAEAKRDMKDQNRAAQRSMPANMTLNLMVTEPASWPAEYPALAPLGAFPAPDGRLWVQRATPARLERERWDVLDQAGKLVARWQLPARVKLAGIGQGAIYTVRVDEDDLRYVQRIELPR